MYVKHAFVICFGIVSETFQMITRADRRCALGDHGRVDHLTMPSWHYNCWRRSWDISWMVIGQLGDVPIVVSGRWSTRLWRYHIVHLIIDNDIMRSFIRCMVCGLRAQWKWKFSVKIFRAYFDKYLNATLS